jgi:multiple sugar transport system ATP-binding protein
VAEVILRGVTKRYGQVLALHQLDLHVNDGEFVVLVGPSGCGKTTALRLIAGLEESSEGHIYIGEKDVTHVAPKDRDVAMVFQSYALYPHMSVYDNMAFGLRMRMMKSLWWQWLHPQDTRRIRNEIEKRVINASEVLGLQNLLKRRPNQLSGGQRQRVALGRAIVRKPKAFLMDEPLSNLDAKLRVQTRAELIRLHRQLGITTLYVTHDQTEAMTMGQRIAVLKDGVLQQYATPETLYNQPSNAFVASFIGTPPMNLLSANIQNNQAVVAGNHITLSHNHIEQQNATIGIRPEAFRTHKTGTKICSSVDVIEPLGPNKLIYLKIGDQNAIASLPADFPVHENELLELWVRPEDVYVFDTVTGKTIN